MKNRILLFIAILLTSIGFIGINSILLSKANIDKNIFLKQIYLNNKDIYDHLIDETSFKIESDVLINENVLSFEIYNVSLNDLKIIFECKTDNNIIEVFNKETYLISKESSIKRSIIINYDGEDKDNLTCKLKNIT